MYEDFIKELDPGVNAKAVAAHLRIKHGGTLDHLPRDAFVEGVASYKRCLKADPDYEVTCLALA